MSISIENHIDYVIINEDKGPIQNERNFTIEELKVLVTKFLKYYREGSTDISDQFPDIPLDSTWQYLPPTHIDENENQLYIFRHELYQ